MRRTLLAAAAAWALLAPSMAAGHISTRPAGITSGETEQVVFEVPSEREGRATTLVELTMPAGLTIEAAMAPPGWLATRDVSTATWTGGRLAEGEVVELELTLTASGRAGEVSIDARQGYDDGEVVTWEPTLTILPATETAPRQRLGRALIASVVGVAIVMGSIVALRRSRRRDA